MTNAHKAFENQLRQNSCYPTLLVMFHEARRTTPESKFSKLDFIVTFFRIYIFHCIWVAIIVGRIGKLS